MGWLILLGLAILVAIGAWEALAYILMVPIILFSPPSALGKFFGIELMVGGVILLLGVKEYKEESFSGKPDQLAYILFWTTIGLLIGAFGIFAFLTT